MNSVIRFLKPNRYGAPDTTNSTLGYGIHQLLVQRGIAEFVKPSVPLSVAAISEPQLLSEPSGVRKRRHSKQETDE